MGRVVSLGVNRRKLKLGLIIIVLPLPLLLQAAPAHATIYTPTEPKYDAKGHLICKPPYRPTDGNDKCIYLPRNHHKHASTGMHRR